MTPSLVSGICGRDHVHDSGSSSGMSDNADDVSSSSLSMMNIEFFLRPRGAECSCSCLCSNPVEMQETLSMGLVRLK